MLGGEGGIAVVPSSPQHNYILHVLGYALLFLSYTHSVTFPPPLPPPPSLSPSPSLPLPPPLSLSLPPLSLHSYPSLSLLTVSYPLSPFTFHSQTSSQTLQTLVLALRCLAMREW